VYLWILFIRQMKLISMRNYYFLMKQFMPLDAVALCQWRCMFGFLHAPVARLWLSMTLYPTFYQGQVQVLLLWLAWNENQRRVIENTNARFIYAGFSK
jgi:hypothetical protein